MKNIPILVFEILLVAFITIIGLSGRKILFIEGERGAIITLGIIGMLLCTLSVGKFISAAPAHPLAFLGYLFGSVALLAFLTQLFRWNIPILASSRTALLVLAGAVTVKSVVARFGHLLAK